MMQRAPQTDLAPSGAASTDVTADVALTIAGFDPSSGAGITADLAVFAAHRIFGTSAITALTVQSTMGVREVKPVSPDLLLRTLSCLDDDLPSAGIKIGMLGGLDQVSAVVNFLAVKRMGPGGPIVVLDTVLQSSSGATLLSSEGIDLMRTQLFPLIDVVTPNTVELSLLSGRPTATESEIVAAAAALSADFPRLSVLATGGHRSKPDDVLLHQGDVTVFPGEHIRSRATHGTGCALSSALLCGLMRGLPMLEAVRDAKAYVTEAIGRAPQRGAGRGPMHLLWPLTDQSA